MGRRRSDPGRVASKAAPKPALKERPKVVKPKVEKPKAEKPKVEKPKVEKPKAKKEE